ncbi:hypothetical protein NUW58_g8904 [Xylaria curta]|uniref:Uncharacterized protein n=1 Tax=Xylaria curta TaxID=42375 RepID=A0ACC1N2S2_9PEZI|nr:hypothetical protein NUW58_g8904 [Xylaria curta]
MLCVWAGPKQSRVVYRFDTGGELEPGNEENGDRYPSSRGSSPEVSFTEVRKTRASRKGHSRNSGPKRSSTYDFGGGFSTVVEEDESAATTSSPARGSRKSAYDTGVDLLTKKAKTPSGGWVGARKALERRSKGARKEWEDFRLTSTVPQPEFPGSAPGGQQRLTALRWWEGCVTPAPTPAKGKGQPALGGVVGWHSTRRDWRQWRLEMLCECPTALVTTC